MDLGELSNLDRGNHNYVLETLYTTFAIKSREIKSTSSTGYSDESRIETNTGTSSLGFCTPAACLIRSSYPSVQRNFRVRIKLANTRTPSCMANFCPTQERPPVEKANKALFVCARNKFFASALVATLGPPLSLR